MPWLPQFWYNTNVYGSLTTEERRHNAQNIRWYFRKNWDWTMVSIAAMVGNMSMESGLSPQQWEGGQYDPYNHGYGLVQWTPPSKPADPWDKHLIDWANHEGLDYTNGTTQVRRLVYEYQKGYEFYSTPEYPCTWYRFAHETTDSHGTTIDINYAAAAFVKNYLRPSSPNIPARQATCRTWYNWLLTQPDFPPVSPWLLLKWKNDNDRRMLLK